MKKSIYIVAGARPNFMKIAPIVRALEKDGRLAWKIVHTGQHYDKNMNDVFFEELGIPEPDFFLGCGGGSHAEQTAKIMVKFEKLCEEEKPDCVLVVGDVNSTLACSVVAKKLHIPVAHVEAGLRSGDMAMPEEINRLVTDAISDWFFVTEPSGEENLHKEGKPDSTIHHVGHVMVDNLLYQVGKFAETNTDSFKTSDYKKDHDRYGVVTLHRPSNVDSEEGLTKIFEALNHVATQIPLIFPIHPRTKDKLGTFGITLNENITLAEPLPYMEFLNLWKDAVLVLTDSGGLQEETTALGIPCVTMRENTERPITVDEGTNILTGNDPGKICEVADNILQGNSKKGSRPALWDGKSAERIVDILADDLIQ